MTRTGARDGASRSADRGRDDLTTSAREDRSTRTSGPNRIPSRSQARDDVDERPSRGSAAATREYSRPAQDGRQAGADRDSSSASSTQDRERRGNSGNSGQNARPDSRKPAASTSRRDDSLPDVRPRQAKGKRDSEGEWPSTEWDELSDVDFWVELASDKPAELVADKAPAATTSQPATPPVRTDRDRSETRSSSSDSRSADGRAADSRAADSRSSDNRAEVTVRRDSTSRRDPADRRDSSDRRDTSDRRDRRELPERRDSDRRENLLPAARTPRTTVDAAFAPLSGDSADPLFGGRTETFGSTELRRTIAAGGEPPIAASAGRTSPGTSPRPVVQPADDDPLTSPSFPRITDDSRSYRRSRSEPGTPGRQSGQHPRYEPAAQHEPPQHPPVGPLDSQPGRTVGYGQTSEYAPALPASNTSALSAMPPVQPAQAGQAAHFSPSLPVSAPDPYRSSQDGYPAHASAGTGSYPAPVASSGYQAPSGQGYLPPSGNGYPADSPTRSYSTPMAAAPVPAPVPAPLAPPAYPSALPGYDSDSGGYASPPGSRSGYGSDHDNGYALPAAALPAPALPDYASAPPSYPVTHAAEPQSAYASQDYQATAPHVQPAQQLSYPQPGGASLPGQTTGGYGGYPTASHSDQSGLYQIPAAPVTPAIPAQPELLPPAGGGYGADYSQSTQHAYPAPQYGPATYDPPGYAAPGYESETAYPADPYAVDPYGYPGYGTGRLADQRPLAAEPWDDHPWQGQGWDGQQWPAPVWDDQR